MVYKIIFCFKKVFFFFKLRFCILVPAGVPQPGGGVPQIPVDTIRRHEVDSVLANQREMVGASREIK